MTTLTYDGLLSALRDQSYPFDTILMQPGDVTKLRQSGLADNNVVSFGALGLRVMESEYARMPARKHKRRRWMSEAYHRRIQKKWDKRFGYVPAAFLLNTRMMLDLRIRKHDLFADPRALAAMVA